MSLKKPFAWTDSAHFANIVRRMRVKDITRPWRTNRPAAIGITAIGVVTAGILIAVHDSPAR